MNKRQEKNGSEVDSDQAETFLSFRRINKTFMLIALLLPAAVFLSTFLARFSWLFESLCNFQFLWFAGMLVAAVGFTLFRSWIMFTINGLLLLLSAWAVFSIYLPSGDSLPEGRVKDLEKIKILSLNLLHENDSFERTIESIHEIDADIVLLVEYTSRWKLHLQELTERYPHHVLRPRRMGSGMAIYSKKPLESFKVFQLTRDQHDCPMIHCVFRLDGQPVNLFGVHTLSPRYPEFLEIRNQQLNELQEIVNDFPGEKIVAGDFNATTWSPFLRDFVRNTRLKDSRQGIGLQSSWPERYWMLRIAIDHSFCSENMIVRNRKIYPEVGSDHFPVVTEYSILPDQK